MRAPACVTVLSAAAALGVACGSSTPNSPSGASQTNIVTAVINGVSFSAQPPGPALSLIPGSLALFAVGVPPSTTGLTLDLGFVVNPGTYPLGVDEFSTPGGTLTVVSSLTNGTGTIFITPESGTAGSVTITSLTTTAVAGVFQASLVELGTSATTLTVTNGTFNVPLSGFVPATSPGNSLSATVNGSAFVAANVTAEAAGAGFGVGGFSNSATGSETDVELDFSQMAVGTYAWFASTAPSVTVSGLLNDQSFGQGLGAGGTGSATIASISAAGVVQGTFSGTVNGVSITNGQFTAQPSLGLVNGQHKRRAGPMRPAVSSLLTGPGGQRWR